MKTIDDVKAWMTNGLLVVLGWFVVDLKNDVKILLDRTARLEVKAEYQESERQTADLIHFKGMEFIFDRQKIFTKTHKGYEYI